MHEENTIIPKSLLERVQAHTAEPLRCALAQSKACCNGRGVQMSIRGPYVWADLCDCVQKCLACYGRCMLIEGGKSRPCQPFSPVRRVQLLRDAQIPARYSSANMQNFMNYTGNGQTIKETIYRWHQNFKLGTSRGFILSGPVGVGKTFMLAALAYELAARGISVRFVDFFQLLSELKAGYTEKRSEAEILGPLIERDVLFIDELGKGRHSEWELTILDQLIMGRYNQNKTIVASTNCDLFRRTKAQKTTENLANTDYLVNDDKKKDETKTEDHIATSVFGHLEDHVGPRIFSRLREMTTFLHLTGRDYRSMSPAMNQQQQSTTLLSQNLAQRKPASHASRTEHQTQPTSTSGATEIEASSEW